MPLTDDDLSVLYRELTGSRTDRGACPASETLARAAAGDLESTERDAVVAHLEICQMCAQDFRIACGLQAGIAPQQTAGRASQFWSGTPLPQAVAASLAIVSAGLIAWNVSLQQRAGDLETRLDQALRTSGPSPSASTNEAAARELATVRQQLDEERVKRSAFESELATLQSTGRSGEPQFNIPLVDLEPVGAIRTAPGRVRTVELPTDAAFVMVILATTVREGDYLLEIRDAAGRVAWQGSGLKRTALGTINLALPKKFLPSGAATLRLYSIRNGERAIADEYSVQFSDRKP